jgi:urease accessory protein
MSTEALLLLKTVQQADSFFPTGGSAFSWGLETIIADRCVDLRQALAIVVITQLKQRWAVFDRGILAAAHAAGDQSEVNALDHEVEAMLLPSELREGSRRAGATLLDVHQRLGTPAAAAYRGALRTGAALGHLNVVQGRLWSAQGLSAISAQAMSAHAFCIGMLSAAIRLGAAGHIQAQRALIEAQVCVATLLDEPAPALGQCHAFTPQLDIASMRHETQTARLFVN